MLFPFPPISLYKYMKERHAAAMIKYRRTRHGNTAAKRISSANQRTEKGSNSIFASGGFAAWKCDLPLLYAQAINCLRLFLVL